MIEVIEQFVSAITDDDAWMGPASIAELFGAECIGQGIDRAAYLLGDRVVKINLHDDGQTQLERYNYFRLTADGHRRGEWAIPLMHFMETPSGLVTISEFIEGEGLNPYRRWNRSDNPFNVMDCHGENIIRSLDGIHYIIDLGYAHGYQTCVLNGHIPVGDYECTSGCYY